jgi:hypothetical protein
LLGSIAFETGPGTSTPFLDGRLPYTGLALWFVLPAALAVVACGRILR